MNKQANITEFSIRAPIIHHTADSFADPPEILNRLPQAPEPVRDSPSGEGISELPKSILKKSRISSAPQSSDYRGQIPDPIEMIGDSQFPEEAPFPPPGLASDYLQDAENVIDADPGHPFGFQPINLETELEQDYPSDPIYPADNELVPHENQQLTDKTHYFHFDLSVPDQLRIAAIRIWHNLCCPTWKQLRQALLESKVPKVLYDELRRYVSVKDKARLSSRPPVVADSNNSCCTGIQRSHRARSNRSS